MDKKTNLYIYIYIYIYIYDDNAPCLSPKALHSH